MASLQEIKSRLNSISTTKKITKAMQLVATAKLKKAKDNLEGIQEYYTSVYDMFQELLSNVKDTSILEVENPKDSILYIIITSDIGLAGSYNSSILKLAKKKLRSHDKVIMLGNKGISSFKANNINIDEEFPSVGDNPNYKVANEIAKIALALYMAGDIKGINILHTKYINSVTFLPTSTQLLPIKKSETNKNNTEHALTEFEPSAEEVLSGILPLYLSAQVFGMMVESKVSEMSSRRTAMENATDNAEELIDQLDIEYNRARQAAITQELNEIVAGSEIE